jgi:hypothetical protein
LDFKILIEIMEIGKFFKLFFMDRYRSELFVNQKYDGCDLNDVCTYFGFKKIKSYFTSELETDDGYIDANKFKIIDYPIIKKTKINSTN